MFSTSPPIPLEQFLLLMTSRKLHMRFLSSWITTLCPIKKTRHFYFCDNSGKYWPISIILSLSHSQMNCRKRFKKYLPPHLKSVAALPCKNVQLSYFTACYFNAVVRRIIYLQYLSSRDAKLCFLCLIIKYCVKIVCPQHTNMLWDMHAIDATDRTPWLVVKCYSAKCSNDV